MLLFLSLASCAHIPANEEISLESKKILHPLEPIPRGMIIDTVVGDVASSFTRNIISASAEKYRSEYGTLKIISPASTHVEVNSNGYDLVNFTFEFTRTDDGQVCSQFDFLIEPIVYTNSTNPQSLFKIIPHSFLYKKPRISIVDNIFGKLLGLDRVDVSIYLSIYFPNSEFAEGRSVCKYNLFLPEISAGDLVYFKENDSPWKDQPSIFGIGSPNLMIVEVRIVETGKLYKLLSFK